MEPASSVIELLGGEKVVSKITGTAYTAPYRWQQPREKGGTGGTIPQRHHNALLAYARENRLPLTAEALLPRASDQERRDDWANNFSAVGEPA